eukprot:GHVQ01024733.1.p1 GENE.GHVQ01024733.1~~GHVQ01024733.1.p1  ORF type:complete len:263 (-),score=55.68 GHVQ01024733.1:898-1686(-)
MTDLATETRLLLDDRTLSPPPTDSLSITSSQMEAVLRGFVTSESLNRYSRKNCRHELERRVGLEEDGLKNRREEINKILEKIVGELAPDLPTVDTTTTTTIITTTAGSSVSSEQPGSDPSCTLRSTSSPSPPLDEWNYDIPIASATKRGRGEVDDDEEEEEDRGESDAKKLKQESDPPKNLKKLQHNLMSKQQFLSQAGGLTAVIGPTLKFEMAPRLFKPGSCGWYWGGKVQIPVGDKMIWCQLGVNCSVLGSKEWNNDDGT